ncbi:MAG: hypothetical protein WD276_00750 [Actinomycetota bacterium]
MATSMLHVTRTSIGKNHWLLREQRETEEKIGPVWKRMCVSGYHFSPLLVPDEYFLFIEGFGGVSYDREYLEQNGWEINKVLLPR